MNDFVKHYLLAALWSSTDENSEFDDSYMDTGHTLSDFAPETLERAIKDCEQFQKVAAHLLEKAYQLYDSTGQSDHPDAGSAEACAAHDFWLTRNGHGVGFWDRGLGKVGNQLTELVAYGAQFRPVSLYVQDGLIYSE